MLYISESKNSRTIADDNCGACCACSLQYWCTHTEFPVQTTGEELCDTQTLPRFPPNVSETAGREEQLHKSTGMGRRVQ